MQTRGFSQLLLSHHNEVLANFINHELTTKAVKHSTVARRVKALKSLLMSNVDLDNPRDVVKFLNLSKWSHGSKDIAVTAYRDYLAMKGITDVFLPKFKKEDVSMFIPTEEEIDALISDCGKKTATFLKLLKDTGVRPIEAHSIKWLDIDVANKLITIRKGFKYSQARKLKVSEQTLNMLLSLKKRNEYVFSPSGKSERFEVELDFFRRCFNRQRDRTAEKLQNPRIKMISLKTFRHWKATMEYIKTRDIMHVKEFLGHYNIKNTLRYMHIAQALTQFSNEWTCKVAKTLEEACRLVEQGFEFVTDMDGAKIFRKRK